MAANLDAADMLAKEIETYVAASHYVGQPIPEHAEELFRMCVATIRELAEEAWMYQDLCD